MALILNFAPRRQPALPTKLTGWWGQPVPSIFNHPQSHPIPMINGFNGCLKTYHPPKKRQKKHICVILPLVVASIILRKILAELWHQPASVLKKLLRFLPRPLLQGPFDHPTQPSRAGNRPPSWGCWDGRFTAQSHWGGIHSWSCLVVWRPPHPSEKYDFVNWDEDRNPILMGKCQKWHQTTKQYRLTINATRILSRK